MAQNIVESIIVQLGLDGSQYNQEAEKAKKSNKELTKSVSETDKVVGNVTKTIARWFSVMAVATGVAKMIDEAQRLNDELFHLEKNLGMSSETIKNWQGAAGAMGGSADGMTNSIKSLNMGMNDFVTMGDTNLLPFMNALGVGMVDAQGKLRDTDQVMLDLADSFSKMDREQAFSIASKMGIDEGTFNTLVQGRKEMEKMLEHQSKMYKSSEEELKASRALAQNRALLGQHWESLKTMMANAIIPLFVKLSEVALGIFEYLQEHQQAVQAVFKGISFVVGAILIPILTKATIAALAFIAPFAPFILVVGALGAAFGLLYDDYKTWAEGGKSLFDWGLFTSYIDNAKFSTENLTKGFTYLLTGYTDWTKVAEDGRAWLKLKGFIDQNGVSLKSLANGFKNVAIELVQSTIPTLRGYGEIMSKLFSGDFKGAAMQAGDMVKNFAIQELDRAKAMWGRITGATDVATGQPIGTLGGSMPSQQMEAKGGSGKKAQFVQKYLPVAQAVGSKLGVPPEALLGQWALETGWGASITPGTGFNLGNIKAGSSWKGKTVRAYDKVEKSYDPYRVYDTPEAFAEDYVGLISKNKRYRGAIGAKTSEEYFTELKKGGYATDVNYIKHGVATSNSVLREMRPSGAVQQSMRQGDFIDLSKANANQAKANQANSLQVNVGDINIQTSSSTVTGNTQDAMNAVQNQFFQFQNSMR